MIIGFIIYQGWRIASPSKRALQEYHRDWLVQPEKHGILIRETLCLDNKVPALVIEGRYPLGSRGKKLREQMVGRGNTVILENQLTSYHCSHTVVLLHGRNGRKEDLLAVAERFCAVGLRCILIDLPAHGESPVKTVKFGVTEWEQDIPYMVLLECAERYDFSPSKASLWGMSMGGSFANSAAADPEHGQHWRSLVIVCSFDRLDLVVKDQCYSAWLTNIVSKTSEICGGVRLSEAAPADWVSKVSIPVMVIHGDSDNLISEERGRRLYESYASKEKRWVKVSGGTHQNILVTPMPLYAEMAEWILRY